MMLKRLIAKGAVSLDESGKYQQYSAAVAYAEVEPEETASFLTKVYGGSVGLMVSNLVGRGALSEQEIRELKAILDAAEQQEETDMLKDALTLSALIAAVLLVRAAFKSRVPKRLLYALWLVVLLKLCLPGTAVRPAAPACGSSDSTGAAGRGRNTCACPRPPRSSPRRPLTQPQTPAQTATPPQPQEAAKPAAATPLVTAPVLAGLVRRQRAARPLAASYVAGLYGSAV